MTEAPAPGTHPIISDDSGLRMMLQRWSAFGLPLPRALAPQSQAREWPEDGKFRFDVPISLPLLGRDGTL